EGRLPRTRAAADFQPAAVRDAPRERQHLDLVLVFGVGRLALDVADLRENIGGHAGAQYNANIRATWTGRAMIRANPGLSVHCHNGGRSRGLAWNVTKNSPSWWAVGPLPASTASSAPPPSAPPSKAWTSSASATASRGCCVGASNRA